MTRIATLSLIPALLFCMFGSTLAQESKPVPDDRPDKRVASDSTANPETARTRSTPVVKKAAIVEVGHGRMNFQGYAEISGIPYTGSLAVGFRIFDVAAGGTHLWDEAQVVVADSGVFNAEIGTNNPLTLPFDEPYWLAVKLGGDPWMTERAKLLTSPYAFTAAALQGKAVSTAAPAVGNVLIWNGQAWTPGTLPDSNPWSPSGSNIYFNTGNVGIGDNSPAATLTVGNGDKLQVHGADGDIVFKDDQGSLRFANSNGANAPMIQMFQSGTNNSTRMFVAHSPSFPSWGIAYNDTSDAFNWIGDNLPVFTVQLSGQQRLGVGTFTPEAKVHINTNSATGFGHLKLTETQFDYSRITMNNTIHPNYWDIAARTDTNLANAQFNVYHSNVGDILSVNARGRVGINDASPSYTVEINGNGSTRIMNLYNNLATTTNTTYNYGVRSNLSQAANTGFPRLYNFYGISTDTDAYLSYGLYGYASGASNNNYGVYAYAPTSSGYAGYFNGNVYTTGLYQSSDAKLKSNVTNLSSGLDKLMALRPTRSFYRTQEFEAMNLPEGEQFGFIAQEVASVIPGLVKRSFQPYDEAISDTPEGQGIEFDAVNYLGMIPVLVSAIQEQQALIESLQAQVQSLSAQVNR